MKSISTTTLVALFATAMSHAQELDVDIGSDGISIDTQHWYENPIVWVGGVILLVLLIVLVSRSSKAA